MQKIEVKKALGYSPDETDGMVYRMLFLLTRRK